jgi:putative ABC transport system substrate-binding protein
MRRRDLGRLIAGAVMGPFAAHAQVSTRRPLIGFLSAVARERNVRMNATFVQGLSDFGFVDGRDVDIALRSADGHLDRLPALAEEMVALKPDVIFATVMQAVIPLAKLTKALPIVCPFLADPIGLGLIASMAHPGGNVTGVLFRAEGLVSKQLELALELLPGTRKIGFLVDVAGAVVLDREELETAAQKLGVTLVPAEVRGPDEIGTSFHALATEGAQAVIVEVDGLFFNERQQIAAIAADTRLPAVYGFREYVDSGGLISYGVNLAACFRRAAGYVAKILKGAKPGDLPVEFPTTLELVVNLKVAKSLGITVPQSALARADEVIE